jgi:thiol-disulfide isomerase/thioredoxin
MKTLRTILAFLVISFSSHAQLANGSIAPDFNLTDINGNSHHLHQYLAEGKTVFVEFFACHCPTCWSYHNTGKLESLYQNYGPSGSDQIMVIMIEYDQWNDIDEFNGTAGWTQGDWITGSTIPKINAENPDRDVFTDYNMIYFPMVYKICTDKTTELMDISYSTEELFQKADACPGALTINENVEAIEIVVDNTNQKIILKNIKKLKSLNVINITGQIIKRIEGNNSNSFDTSFLTNGIYLLQIEHEGGTVVKKIFIRD